MNEIFTKERMDNLTIPLHDVGGVSDGYHTFNELYAHRVALFALVLQLLPEMAWRSEYHSDGTRFDGWFVAGLNTLQGQITYHVPMEQWNKPEWKGVITLSRGPKWGGHSSDDVLTRVAELTIQMKKMNS